jgi:PucR-like helix-turn-helix protein/diguanylate cyclase with GGDEF domain
MASVVATDLIADALAARRDAILSAAVTAYVERIPAYRNADPSLIEDARRHTGEHHDLLCAVLRRGAVVELRELDFVERFAAHRARRGIPLSDFLEAFRSYHSIVWDAIVEVSRESHEAADQALAAARTVIQYVDRATTRASAAYLDAQQLLLANSDRVRRDLLEDLLDSGAPQTAATLAAARDAGLDGDARCVVLAAVPTEPPEDESVLPRAARAVAAAIAGREPPLAVARRGEIVVVRAVAPGERVALRAPLERVAAGLAVGVSTVQSSPASLGAAYREASQALRRVADGGGVLSLPDLTAFEYLTLRDDGVARRLIAPEVEQFVAEDREHGGHLIETLLAYADADLNAKAAAERLLVHVNTAHYRLARIAERTGCDLRRLSDVIDLLIAIRLTGR